ncbi:MAG TPA: ThuA domain-containing protein [Bryobacteraceae bacterium]|nr:ThuA domain-containing protein [Bryobacteraceae bacterium]
MKALRYLAIVLAVAGLAEAQQAQTPRKRLLVIAQTKGFQHDSISHAMATLERLGKENGWDTYLRTDTQLITKKKLGGNAKNLDYFNAIAFFTTGDLDLDDSQKADLLAFVRDEGKGFIGMHTAGDTLTGWPEYGEMVGGYFDLHPWNTFMAPVIVEDQTHPITKHFPKSFTIRDEIYQYKNWSREKVRVLMSLDASKLDLNNKNVRRTDKDFAVAWIKPYGKGRVFATTLGHVEEVYDRADIQKMFVEAIKWAMGVTPAGDMSPRPKAVSD